MRILITGSEGTIGRPLARELERRGHEVWGCDLQHAPREQYYRADVGDYRQLERVFERSYDIVYHLAAEFGRINGEMYYETLWRTNAVGTRNILEWQLNTGFKLIFSSTSEIYGESHGELLDEDYPTRQGIVQPNDYALSKWCNEVQIMNFERAFGSECMRLRFFNVYGPGEHYHPYRNVIALFCYRALKGLPYTVYEGYYRTFMFIDDFIPTLGAVADNFIPGEVVNIGGAELRSVKDASQIIRQYLGLTDALVDYQFEDAQNVVSKQPDITKAREMFGHDPTTTLEEGIPKTIEWMREVYA